MDNKIWQENKVYLIISTKSKKNHGYGLKFKISDDNCFQPKN
jgi:hypothetical protein